MAENKEERIAIYVTEDKIIEGGYGDFYNTIPYKKAINKMAREIYLILHPEESYAIATLMNNVVNDYRKIAESALNALLEVEK